MSGTHPLAPDDAVVARARIRAASVARDCTRRPCRLAFLRQATATVRLCHRDRGAVSGPRRAEARAVLPVAARLRLDPPSRLSGAARRDLPGTMEAAPAIHQQGRPAVTLGAAALTPRELILATIRRSLGVTGTEAPRRLEVATRLT